MQHYNPDFADYFNEHGMYCHDDEHDACGVGLIASITGDKRRDVVEKGIDALKSVWHRGALNADGKTGDGAGIHIQVPDAFFAASSNRYKKALNDGYHIGVGMLFLPRTNAQAQEAARLIVETEIVHAGYELIGWRQVPVQANAIGDDANEVRPEIMQVFIRSHANENKDVFERKLYIVRRMVERRLRDASVMDCYICSLSCRYIIYKGLFQAAQLCEFYPELNNPLITSNYIIFHQRFSTNTAPSWHLAQPFRALAHNGEINTLRGNVNWMSSYEACFGAEEFNAHSSALTPIVPPNASDTAALDSVMEFITLSGKSLPFTKLMMMPPAWSRQSSIPARQRALYEYCNCLMSPWDGPAAIAATDGRWILAGLDRNGLRPLRYAITNDNLLCIGSETGMVTLEDTNISALGQLAPGQMIGVNLEEGRLYRDDALKDTIANQRDYSALVQPIPHVEALIDKNIMPPAIKQSELKTRQHAFGTTQEEIDLILRPMMEHGKEGIGSMGDDTPLAVLSRNHRGLHHFFRQHFSQVTNPPIDPLREQHTMSLITRIGKVKDILGDTPDFSHILHMDTPIMSAATMQALINHAADAVSHHSICFSVSDNSGALRAAINALIADVDAAHDAGKSVFILDDSDSSIDRIAIPAILAAGAVHTHMVRLSKRKQLSIIVKTGTVLDTHSMAVLIGVGATAVYPYLVEAAVMQSCEQEDKARAAFDNVKEAYAQGLLKIMSKMGISVISSYRGGRNFDAIGLSRSLVAEFFPGLVSRISGIGMRDIYARALDIHRQAWTAHGDDDSVTRLPIGGHYRHRRDGEAHAYEGAMIHTLQTACATDSYTQYKRFADMANGQHAIHVRSLLDIHCDSDAIALADVESVNDIRKRFVAPAMSLGALSPEAHETLAIAMNRIGAQSNSGEGGEGSERFSLKPNGDNACTTIKQVASGRFGVTAHYLNQAKEIQIKVAQGAKPGEGGQLPGFKVTTEIARLRHATKGVTLISPPPHHDIYSIEDLAQLIYDLKQINPTALVSVKLVSQSGIGTIASGVVKALADKIIISGHSGGTGASPYSSIKYAGTPWEMGLAETMQVLSLNKLRNRVTLQTDGGLKTGRDIIIAAMLGAEEFAIGTLSLVAMGCLMVRQCHSNTCPVGICTQDETLRKHFGGSPEKVINLMSFIAEDIREILASLGYRSLDDIIGRTDLLRQVEHENDDYNKLDLTPLLTRPVQFGEAPRINTLKQRNAVANSLDECIVADITSALNDNAKIQLHYTVNNTHRSIGTYLSGHVVRQDNEHPRENNHIHIVLRGTAGQSLGAFLVQGITLEMIGDANDYVGKGLSGGHIIVRTPPSSTLVTQHNAIIGNTVLYGATSGSLFAAGRAGDRFAVRNSGANAVIEGCGSNGCEYMTGGTVIILGAIGSNFGAGMTGGMAFIYDTDNALSQQINPENVIMQRINSHYWDEHCRILIEQHAQSTYSLHAQNIVNQWDEMRQHMWQICPKELLDKLPYPLDDNARNVSDVRQTVTKA